MEALHNISQAQCLENRMRQDVGDVRDWHHAVGTGPFMLQNFVSGSSATLVKNPIIGQPTSGTRRINCLM